MKGKSRYFLQCLYKKQKVPFGEGLPQLKMSKTAA